MNAPFTVAQAMTTGQGTSQAPQIVKLTKPANGQAVSLTLDANTRLDFSDIAGEQITLVRVGNQLVILFDNQTTITAGPFFDASGNPLPDVHVDLGNNRIVDGQEFAGLFPISTDTNILPASGAGGGGDGFLGGDPNVDPLNTGNPLDLLGNEDGNGLTFSITEALGRNNNETTPIEPAPTAFSQTIGIDEDGDAPFQLFASVAGGPGDSDDPVKYFGGPNAPTPSTPLFSFGPDGPAAVDPIVFDTAALDLLGLTSGGQPVTWTQFGDVVTGRAGGELIVIELRVLDLATGDFSVEIFRPLDHPAPVDGVADENEIDIPFNFTLTDGNGTTAGGTLTVSVDDDSPDPCNPVPGFVEETGALVQATVNLDLEWGADNNNFNQGPIDRSIAFANTTPGDNVAVSDINGDPLPTLTSNGETVLYTIIGPVAQGDPVYLVAYTDPKSVPTSQTDSGVVFWVSLSDQNLGDAVFELRGPLDHPAPLLGSAGYEQALDLTFSFNAFDADGDGVTGTFTIRVDAAGDVYVCGCGYATIDYSALPGGVFINLDDKAHTEWGQTVDADTATDLDGVSPKVIGIDKVDGITHAIGTDSADVIIGGDEGNTLEGLGGADLIRGGRGADVIYGDAGQDTIYGGRGDDAIQGGDGADTIYGGRGWDEIEGGAGADWISGGADSDFLKGQGGDDTIRGGAGADLIEGGAGEDDIRGGAGWDEIYGDAGNDTIRGGRGNDYIEGNGGDDNIRGGRGDDEIYGGAGNDTIRGGQDDDYIEGNSGDDRIIYNVGEGHDLVFGGGGDDIQEIYGTGDSETYNINAINIAGDLYVGVNIRDGVSLFDVVPATPGNAEVATKGVEDIYIDTGAGPDNVFILGSLGGTGLATSTITIEGGPGDDTDIVDASLLASNHSVTFYGRGGEDAFALNTGKGTDTFDGGSGLDTAFFSCNVADATIAFDGTHWTVTVGGSTDTLIGVEGMTFLDQAFLLVDHAGPDVGGFQTIQDAVDASCGCQTVLIAPGTYNENVTIDNNDVSLMGLDPTRTTIITGQITVSGEINSDVTFSNLAIDAAGETYGVFVTANSDAFGGEIVLDNVLIENAGNNGFAYIRADNGGVPTLADTIGAIAILNSEFAGNGGAAGNTNGDILIYGFNGDLTIDTVSIHDAAAGADKAIQVRGIQDPFDVTNVGPFASFGDVTITDLTITGTYSQDLVAFYRIADFANFIATNVTLNANAPWGLFNLDEAGGTVDLSGVAGTNGAGPFIATMQGLDAGDVFTGTGGNDMFVGRGGDDNLAGGGGNDTFVYSVGGGRDIVDGGTESGGKDVLDITGTSANENFFVEIPAEYTARTGNAYAGSEILVSSDDDILVEASEIEDIVIHGGGGADTLTVSGSFTGTSLLTSTITYDSGAGDDTLDLRNRDSNHRVVADGSAGTDTVIYDFARSSVTSVTEIYDTDGVTVIGANITHNTPNGPVTDVLKNFESFQFSDGTRDLTTVFNQAPDAVDDALANTPAGLIQYEFSGTVTGQDEFVPWSSTYKFTIVADRDARATTSFGYDIPLVTSATLSLPYFSSDVMNITTPVRLGYNTTTNRVFFAATGTGHEDAYTITLTEPQEGIFTNQPTFGPLTGTAAQFNFIGLRDLIGNGLPPHIVFTGGTVTANVTAYGAARIEDATFTIAASSLIGNDTDQDGDPVTVTSVQGAVNGTVSLSNGNIFFTPTSNYFGAASFTYTVSDGRSGTDTATVSFNVAGVNDAPRIDLDANDSTIGAGASFKIFSVGGSAIQVTDNDVSISDVDSTTMAGATIAMIGAQSGDLLGIASGGLPAGITVLNQSATSITLTGTASLASYEAAIEAITFSSSSVSTTQRGLSITINDGNGGAAGTTALIGINSPPTIVSAENGDITEDSNPVFGANLTANPGLSAATSPQIYFPGWTPIGGWIWQRPPDGNNGSDAATVYNGGYIFQNVSTVAGQLYQLDYYIKTYSQGNLLQVLWDGVVMTTVSGPSNGFTHLTLQLVGDGDVTQLRFLAPSGAVVLDDVYLRPLSAPAQQTDSGTIVFGDVNTADTHSATFAEQALGYIGTFTLGAVDQNGNSVGWNFVVDNSALQTLGAGDTLTQTYAVTVTDQHGSSVVRNVTVTMNGVNDAVVITSNDGNPLAVSVVENTAAVATIVASDVDVGDVRTWSLSGADATLFAISTAGVITFNDAPNYESPADSGGNNVYNLIVNVSDGTASDTQTVTVTVGNVNEAPVFAGPAFIGMAENGTFVTDVNATDPDAGQTLTYSLGNGFNANLFQIDASTGVLSFIAAPDFETPLGLSGNGYLVTVQVSDGVVINTRNIQVIVTNINEAPVITSNGGAALSVNAAENQTAVATIVAADPDAGTTLAYALSGADATLFNISNAGVITFNNAPNYESPADSGGNNVYDLIVNVSDGTASDTQAVTVTVGNVNEAPVLLSSSFISMAENGTFVTDVNATDPDAGQTLIYSLGNGFNGNLFQIDASTGVLSFIAAPDFETPLGPGNSYLVTVQVSDGVVINTRNTLVFVTDINEAPVITSNGGDIQILVVPENTTAVTTIAVFDADAGDTRTWSLEGVDASKFNISNTGVITFKTAPDIENPSDSGGNWTYDLIARVTDSAGLFDRQQLVVYLEDRNDAPSGTNNNIQITEDVTYTFAVADFGFSDSDGNQFAGVVVNTSPDSAHGQLFRGGLAVNAGDTISAADIAAGMLTYTPFADRFNGQSSFTFSVRDDGASGSGHQNTDQSPDTMRMTFTGGNQADNVDATPGAPTLFSPTTGGFQSFADLSASGSDEFRWNGLGGQFNSLDMQRNGDDLQITFNSNTTSGVFTILDQFAPGGDSTIEGMRFDTAMFYGQLGLAGPYTLGQATDGTGLLDILVGGSGNDTRSGGGNWDAIFGGGGNDTLSGGFENDILVGGLGNDILSGDSGRDFLIGGAGADTFRYAETGSANIDRILDYSFAQGDRLDLSSLLDANFGQGAPANSVVSNFVRVLAAGTDGLVQVDVDGTGGASTWTDVAVLASYSTGNQVLVNFENQAHQLQVA